MGAVSNDAPRLPSTSSENAGVEGTHGELSNSKPSFPTTFEQWMEVWFRQLANADINLTMAVGLLVFELQRPLLRPAYRSVVDQQIVSSSSDR